MIKNYSESTPDSSVQEKLRLESKHLETSYTLTKAMLEENPYPEHMSTTLGIVISNEMAFADILTKELEQCTHRIKKLKDAMDRLPKQ